MRSRSLGLDVHVVEMAPYPMPQQLGEGGGRMLGRWVDSLGVAAALRRRPRPIRRRRRRQRGRPPDVGRDCIPVRHRGVLGRCATSRRGRPPVGDRRRRARRHRRRRHVADLGIRTSGRSVKSRCTAGGCTASSLPATRWRRRSRSGSPTTAAHRSTGAAIMSTKLKLLGVDVASFGQSNASGEGIDETRLQRPGQQASSGAWPSMPSTGALLGGCVRRRHVRLRAADGDHPRPGHPARRPARVRAAVVGPATRSG